MDSEKPSVVKPEILPPELRVVVEAVKKITEVDFSNIPGHLRPEKKGTIPVERLQDNPVVFTDKQEQKPLVTHLKENLDTLLVQTLSPEKIEQLEKQGVLRSTENGGFTFVEGVTPAQKLVFIEAIVDQIQEKGVDPYVVVLDNHGIHTDHFLTAIQAVAVGLGEEAIAQYRASHPSESRQEEVKGELIRRRIKAKEKFRISSAFSRPIEEDVLELDVEKEMIFKVKRDEKIADDHGQQISFGELVSQLKTAVEAGQYDQIGKIRDRFNHVFEHISDPKDRIDMVRRLRRVMASRLTSEGLPEDKKAIVHALLGKQTASFDNNDFQEAVGILFGFEEYQQRMVGAGDRRAKRKVVNDLYRSFFEWGGVVFGTEGIQRLVEVDLRTAVGLQDVLLTPEERLKRIRLQQEINQRRATVLAEAKAKGQGDLAEFLLD